MRAGTGQVLREEPRDEDTFRSPIFGWGSRVLSIAYLVVITSLYAFLVSLLKWSSVMVLPVSLLYLACITLSYFWNMGYGVTLWRRCSFSKMNATSPSAKSHYSWPSVSLIVPTYRESSDSIKSMIDHFGLVDYPRERIHLYICDDAPDPFDKIEMEQMCSGRDNVTYVSRYSRIGYKAGAVNNVLRRITSQYVICLDADHLPTRNLVKRLVESIQSLGNDFLMFPQYFRNENENNIARTTALMQKVDYVFDRFARTVTNSAFCVTTNWIASTDTLHAIGGLDETTITEDLATGIVAHANGFKIGVIEDALAFGLTPNKLDAWRKQQYRWSYGTFHVARTVFKRYWRSLSLSQVFDYLQCISWYLVGPLSFALYLFPILSAFGLGFLKITNPLLFVSATLGIIGFSWFASNAASLRVARSLKRVIMKQAIGLCVSDVYVKALLDNLRGKKPEFHVTDKTKANHESINSVFKSMKYHIAFFAAGIAASFYLLIHASSLVSVVDLGWIWYNNIWVLVGVVLARR
jgi:cellulose synthase/poly-beta-1,6-N-acetylglucosamine synthase-like glycosyltransferase